MEPGRQASSASSNRTQVAGERLAQTIAGQPVAMAVAAEIDGFASAGDHDGRFRTHRGRRRARATGRRYGVSGRRMIMRRRFEGTVDDLLSGLKRASERGAVRARGGLEPAPL